MKPILFKIQFSPWYMIYLIASTQCNILHPSSPTTEQHTTPIHQSYNPHNPTSLAIIKMARSIQSEYNKRIAVRIQTADCNEQVQRFFFLAYILNAAGLDHDDIATCLMEYVETLSLEHFGFLMFDLPNHDIIRNNGCCGGRTRTCATASYEGTAPCWVGRVGVVVETYLREGALQDGGALQGLCPDFAANTPLQALLWPMVADLSPGHMPAEVVARAVQRAKLRFVEDPEWGYGEKGWLTQLLNALAIRESRWCQYDAEIHEAKSDGLWNYNPQCSLWLAVMARLQVILSAEEWPTGLPMDVRDDYRDGWLGVFPMHRDLRCEFYLSQDFFDRHTKSPLYLSLLQEIPATADKVATELRRQLGLPEVVDRKARRGSYKAQAEASKEDEHGWTLVAARGLASDMD
jgi:hypothetical protein